ncbi:hypothetical protein FB451DRAFT_1170231 [Mycena latifolia]|nr:hypothetical protein FB451DRAFT_1170231 [Mycena latifolia]
MAALWALCAFFILCTLCTNAFTFHSPEGFALLPRRSGSCARFRSGIPIIGLTATLLANTKISGAIFDMLGVNRGEFYLLRRSNARHDIQILFRAVDSRRPLPVASRVGEERATPLMWANREEAAGSWG